LSFNLSNILDEWATDIKANNPPEENYGRLERTRPGIGSEDCVSHLPLSPTCNKFMDFKYSGVYECSQRTDFGFNLQAVILQLTLNA